MKTKMYCYGVMSGISRYEVDLTISQIENNLRNINQGYEECLIFKNANLIDQGITYEIQLLTIKPSLFQNIEYYEIGEKV